MPIDLAVGITTAKRREQYALETVKSFRKAGFPQTLQVYAEPGAHDLKQATKNCQIHKNAKNRGCFQNWKWALTHMTQTMPDADWYMVVQDDVSYRSDAWKVLKAAIENPGYAGVGFLSPYASSAMVPALYKKDGAQFGHEGWIQAGHGKGKGFWGALTICMPAESARRLLNFKRFKDHNHHRKIDVIVGNCFRDMKRDRLIHIPSLADHIGKVSTIGRHKIRGISHGRRGFKYQPSP